MQKDATVRSNGIKPCVALGGLMVVNALKRSLSSGDSALQRNENSVDPAVDLLLVRRFKQGEERAFNELVNRHKRRVYAVAIRLLHDPDDAADLAQEAFVRAYQSLHRFKENPAFYTWLYRIIVNLCLNHLKQRRRRREQRATLEEAKAMTSYSL